jgi:hypothetical protein
MVAGMCRRLALLYAAIFAVRPQLLALGRRSGRRRHAHALRHRPRERCLTGVHAHKPRVEPSNALEPRTVGPV